MYATLRLSFLGLASKALPDVVLQFSFPILCSVLFIVDSLPSLHRLQTTNGMKKKKKTHDILLMYDQSLEIFFYTTPIFHYSLIILLLHNVSQTIPTCYSYKSKSRIAFISSIISYLTRSILCFFLNIVLQIKNVIRQLKILIGMRHLNATIRIL